MLLIFAEHSDISTDKVCNWLNYYKAEYIRLNSTADSYNVFGNIHFWGSELSFELNLKGKTYNLDEIGCIWCRRGYLHIKFPSVADLNINNRDAIQTIEKHLINETNTLQRFFEYLLNRKLHINNLNHYNSNKLIALQMAQQVRLKIPETLITQNADDLKNFIKTHKKVVTKNIQDILTHSDTEYCFGHSTTEITEKDITVKNFFYSLFQQKIEAKYELRIFYLLGKFFCHAAFASKNTNDCDIRNAGNEKILVPFELPKEIKIKLNKFMQKMSLESGSIDMIVNEKDDYYFLEVNPVGQFGYVSGFNNYYIEREIAKTLIKFENEHKFNKNKEKFSF